MNRLLICVLVLIVAIASAWEATAQRTTRSRLRPARNEQPASSKADYDTVFVVADSADIVFSGYEKTLRSTKESFFVSNRTDSIIDRLIVTITYKDMDGRQLDTRTAEIDLTLEPASTRRVDLSAWDKQKVFYYYLSPRPRTAHATPYKVSISTVAALRKR